jgi:Ca2+-binding EF-hand superfamily protein
MNHLVDITINSGQEGLDKVGKAFNEVTDGMSDEQASKFTAALNAIDWQDATALNDFPNTLKELGISVPTDELDALIESCIEAAGAIENVDFEKLTESIKST